jgi:hypothetical protein
LLDAREAMVKLLENLDVKNPEAMLSAGQPIPPEVLDLIAQHLAELGVDPNAAQQLVAGSLQEAMQQRRRRCRARGMGISRRRRGRSSRRSSRRSRCCPLPGGH